MSKSVAERVTEHCAQLRVGDRINCFLTGADAQEVEGRLVAITADGRNGTVELPWGRFRTHLSTAKKLDG